MSCFLSIIIPTYNSAYTLRRCLTSVLSQIGDNMEVLIIDDGSTDSTPNICDEYSSIDSRVRVFHKINGGVSSARNVGIENALGQWLIFVDSDDVLAENALHLLGGIISKQNVCSPDLIVSNVLLVDKGGKSNILYESELNSLDVLYGSGCWGAVWNKVFSTYIVHHHDIRFDESLHFSEDCLFVAEYCGHVRKIHYIDEVCYIQNLPDSYTAKYNGYNGFKSNLTLYEKIKRVNHDCSINLVDGLTMSLLRTIIQPGNNASKLTSDFKSAVGGDIKHAKGRKKCLIRALSHIDNVAVWTFVLKLHSCLPI